MSTLPFLLSLADELDNLNNRSYLDDFGLGFYPHRHYYRNHPPSLQLSLPSHEDWIEEERNRSRKYHQHHHNCSVKESFHPVNAHSSSTRNKNNQKKEFQVTLDVAQFKHDELKVKTFGDSVIVEGEHEEREDEHGVVSRKFTRKYKLPEGYNPNEVTSTLSTDGVLTVKVPQPMKCFEGHPEHFIEIHETGKKYFIDVCSSSHHEKSTPSEGTNNESDESSVEKQRRKMRNVPEKDDDIRTVEIVEGLIPSERKSGDDDDDRDDGLKNGSQSGEGSGTTTTKNDKRTKNLD